MPDTRMKNNPCMTSWTKYQKCLTYNYADTCIEQLEKFNKCKKLFIEVPIKKYS